MRAGVCLGLLSLVLSGAHRDGGLLRQAPAKSLHRANPYSSDRDAALAGAKLYQRECASCHGEGGEGIGKAPPLNSAAIETATPGALFWVLRNGSLKRGMPPFAHLPEAQRWQIITYLTTLSGRKPQPVP